jgi:F-box-like
MARNFSNTSNPPAIRRKLAALRRQKKTIKDLTVRLERAQLKYDRLEKEIIRYQASVAAVRKCPEEILVMIFELYARRRPWRVTHLLPVCQRWYHIAMNTPTLWNHIIVRFDGEWDVEEEASTAKKEIEACLQRSAGLPLHIVLDLSDIQTESAALKAHVTEFLLEEDPKTEYDELRCFFECLRFSGLVDDKPLVDEAGRLAVERILDRRGRYTASSPGHAWDAISLLVGNDGEHMKRWATLDLLLPETEELSLQVWPLLRGSAPNLTRLSISDVTFLQQYHDTEPFEWLSDLSSLEELTLDSEVQNLNFLKLDFTSLKCLSLEISLRDPYQCLQLSQFASLEHLAVEGVSDSSSSDSESDDSFTGEITLPLLQTLTLSYRVNAAIAWNVPTLRLLRLNCRAALLLDGLPDVQALHVCWKSSRGKQSERRVRRFQHVLKSMVSTYRQMQKLTIRTFLRPIWEEVVRSLREEERSALPTVVFLSRIDDDDVM